MKLIKLSSAALLAMLAMGTATTVVHAADGGSITTAGDMTYKAPDVPTPPDPVDPIDPDGPTPDPDDPIDPVGGLLSLDFVSTLHFGTQEITTKDMEYNAQAASMSKGTSLKPNWAQVTDVRGTLAGWNLTLSQGGQFSDGDPDGTPGQKLDGAQLTFNNGHLVTTSSVPADNVAATTALDSEGAESVIMSASAGTGAGTNLIVFGDDTTKDSSIKLSVPGKTTKLAKTYTTNLTWTLSDTPAP